MECTLTKIQVTTQDGIYKKTIQTEARQGAEVGESVQGNQGIQASEIIFIRQGVGIDGVVIIVLCSMAFKTSL